ncbi:Uncharacterized protein FWK35_00008337 [Aphis craccivora]|uniref:Uncharacterized protein n=1 Tax=Aphis craccivora TaxID=307492 RepID=A0A6G0YVB5_APHCR|nr:Uncharacterized protein FWK35_00008337 [Aphis craccivora]
MSKLFKTFHIAIIMIFRTFTNEKSLPTRSNNYTNGILNRSRLGINELKVKIKLKHFERSDECIDFTMMCVFLSILYSITSRNNASVSNFGSGFRWQSEYPWCIIEFKFFEICRKRENSKRNDDDLSSNDFKYLQLKFSIFLKILLLYIFRKLTFNLTIEQKKNTIKNKNFNFPILTFII